MDESDFEWDKTKIWKIIKNTASHFMTHNMHYLMKVA